MDEVQGIITVNVNQIGPAGYLLETQFPGDRMELDMPGAVFSSPVSVNCKFTKEADNVIVSGTVGGVVRFKCSRCVKDYDTRVIAKVEEVYQIGDKTQIDISQEARESIVLSYPARPLCAETCKGLCQVCGRDLNKSGCKCEKKPFTTLADKLDDFTGKHAGNAVPGRRRNA